MLVVGSYWPLWFSSGGPSAPSKCKQSPACINQTQEKSQPTQRATKKLTIKEMMTMMMSRMRYQCWPIHFLTVAKLSSDSSSFRSVASGPEGSTWEQKGYLIRIRLKKSQLTNLSTLLEDITIANVVVTRGAWLWVQVGNIKRRKIPIKRRSAKTQHSVSKHFC